MGWLAVTNWCANFYWRWRHAFRAPAASGDDVAAPIMHVMRGAVTDQDRLVSDQFTKASSKNGFIDRVIG